MFVNLLSITKTEGLKRFKQIVCILYISAAHKYHKNILSFIFTHPWQGQNYLCQERFGYSHPRKE